LASRLTGWRLDVTGEASYNQNLKDGHRSLLELQGVGEKMASDLYEAGLTSASDVAGATVEELLAVEGIGEKTALVLIEEATILIQEQPPGMSSAEDTETEEDTGTEEDTEIVEPTVLEPSEAGIEEETRADKMQNEDVLSNNKEGSGENAGNEES